MAPDPLSPRDEHLAALDERPALRGKRASPRAIAFARNRPDARRVHRRPGRCGRGCSGRVLCRHEGRRRLPTCPGRAERRRPAHLSRTGKARGRRPRRPRRARVSRPAGSRPAFVLARGQRVRGCVCPIPALRALAALLRLRGLQDRVAWLAPSASGSGVECSWCRALSALAWRSASLAICPSARESTTTVGRLARSWVDPFSARRPVATMRSRAWEGSAIDAEVEIAWISWDGSIGLGSGWRSGKAEELHY